MKLAIIAAIGRNRVIGNKGRLPWHIAEDLKRFKRLTINHTVIMGRTTYESLGHPLPNRRNIVVTSRTLPGVETYPSLDAALEHVSSEDLVFVIGGGRLYAECLDRADVLHLTMVEESPVGDTYFPEYEELVKTRFRPVFCEAHEGYVFIDYHRVTS